MFVMFLYHTSCVVWGCDSVMYMLPSKSHNPKVLTIDCDYKLNISELQSFRLLLEQCNKRHFKSSPYIHNEMRRSILGSQMQEVVTCLCSSNTESD